MHIILIPFFHKSAHQHINTFAHLLFGSSAHHLICILKLQHVWLKHNFNLDPSDYFKLSLV